MGESWCRYDPDTPYAANGEAPWQAQIVMFMGCLTHAVFAACEEVQCTQIICSIPALVHTSTMKGLNLLPYCCIMTSLYLLICLAYGVVHRNRHWWHQRVADNALVIWLTGGKYTQMGQNSNDTETVWLAVPEWDIHNTYLTRQAPCDQIDSEVTCSFAGLLPVHGQIASSSYLVRCGMAHYMPSQPWAGEVISFSMHDINYFPTLENCIAVFQRSRKWNNKQS